MNLKLGILLVLVATTGCKNHSTGLTEITGKRIPVTSEIIPDTAIENYIQPFSEHINKTLDSTIAYNPRDLKKSEEGLNTAIGNLMADIVLEQADPVFNSRTGNSIDMVLLNKGGIRAEIGKGPVTARTAYRIMPFENEIVVAEITGVKVNEMLRYLENNRTAHPLSGIQIRLDQDYKVTQALIKGTAIENTATYYVATSDYLQQGGDGMDFLKNPVNLYRTGYKIRNAIIDYLHKIDTIMATRDNRYIQIH